MAAQLAVVVAQTAGPLAAVVAPAVELPVAEAVAAAERLAEVVVTVAAIAPVGAAVVSAA